MASVICGPNQVLDADQVAQLMRNAGFPESSIPVGVAISFNESSWNTGNCNPDDPNGGSFGLWQINGIHFPNSTNITCAFDPQCATNYAYFLSGGGQDWAGPWTNSWNAYQNGQIILPNGGMPTGGGNQFSTGLTTGKGPGGCPGKGEKCTCPDGYSVTTNNLGTPICKNNTFPYNTASCKECPGSSDPLTKISNFLDSISQFGQWLGDPVRIIKLVSGLLLIGGAILLLINPTAGLAGELSKTMKQAMPNPKASFKKGAK